MSNIDNTKSSYDALIAMHSTVRGFSGLVDLMSEEDDLFPLFMMLSNKLQSDLSVLRRELSALWSYVPEPSSATDDNNKAGVSDMTASNNPT